jgi:signal transduction histidine kinase
MLGKFMRRSLDDGEPDTTLFRQAIGRLIESLLTTGRSVRTYCEMVDILLERGNERAMLTLEGLWNDLLGEIRFQLYCAYEARIEQTGGRVEVGALPAVNADPVQLRQLTQNLVGNALKFAAPARDRLSEST